MKKMILLPVLLATLLHGQLAVQKERFGSIDRDTQVMTDVVFEGGADTLMDVTTRRDEADSMKILRERETGEVEKFIDHARIGDSMGAPTWDGTRFIGSYGVMSTNQSDLALYGKPANPNMEDGVWFFLWNNDLHTFATDWKLGNPPYVGDIYSFPPGELVKIPQFKANKKYALTSGVWVETSFLGYNIDIYVKMGERPIISPVYEPVAARLDPVLVKDSKTNIVWRVYAENGRFFATIEEEQ